MNSIKQKIQSFNEIKSDISEYFGTDIYDGFDDMTSVEWNGNEESIYWLDGENSDLYSAEVYRQFIKKEEYTLAYLDSGCGDKYWAIFDNSKINEDIEDEY